MRSSAPPSRSPRSDPRPGSPRRTTTSGKVVTHVILLLLMVAGGCSGSTAGGLKVNRLIALFRIMREELTKSFRPNIVMEVKNLPLASGERGRVEMLFMFTLAGLSLGVGTLLISAFEPGMSFTGVLSAVTASLFNIGPALAELGPTENFGKFSNPSLLILSFLMMIGRLEFVAACVLVMPSFWRKY
ncbi:MAG: potassium transporter TrkG [Verrucomicrobiales bacterium]